VEISAIKIKFYKNILYFYKINILFIMYIQSFVLRLRNWS